MSIACKIPGSYGWMPQSIIHFETFSDIVIISNTPKVSRDSFDINNDYYMKGYFIGMS